MDRFSSADFGFATNQQQCDKCGMNKEKSHGCCHDEIKLVKIEDDQNKTSQIFFDFTSVKATAIIPSLFITASFYNNNEEADQSVYHSPPLPDQQDAYLQNCVFRI